MGNPWSKTKSGTRCGIYVLMDIIDPAWWLVIPVILLGLGITLMYTTGTLWLLKIAGIFIVAEIAVAVVLTVVTWLWGDEDSAEVNDATLAHGQCWTNIAEISHRNTMHNDH